MNKLILIALFAFLFFGCTKKGTPTPGPTTVSAIIAGKWYYKADTTSEYQNNVLTSMDTLNFNHTDYIQLNQDKSGIMSPVGGPTSFTYTYAAGVLTVSIPQQTNDGRALPPLIETATVKSLTANTLIMQNVIIFTYGPGVIFKEVMNESFEK